MNDARARAILRASLALALGVSAVACGASSGTIPQESSFGGLVMSCVTDGLVIDVPSTVAVSWDGALTMGGTLDVAARWCGEGDITVSAIELRGPGTRTAMLEPGSAALHHAEARVFGAQAGVQLGTMEIVVRAESGSGETIEASARVEVVDDPDRIAAIAACDACGGRFGAQGMARREQCDCPTHDAGARCLSRADCEGPCVFALFETQPAGSTGADGRACAPGEDLRLAVGRCHERALPFGCHPFLESPTTSCSLPAIRGRVPTVCVD